MSSRRCISLSTLVLTLAVAASGCITSKLDHERSEEFVDTAWEFHSPTDPAALILTGSADSTGCGIVDSAVLRAGNDRRKVPSDLGMLWGIHHWPLSPQSPDGLWIAIPISQFDGYLLIERECVGHDLARCSNLQSVCVETDFASRLWHQDFKWLDSTRVQFKAGLSGDLWIFEYDLATQQLTFAGNKHVKLRTSELNAPGAKY